jgi:conjugal transfer/type IV secretion protein DotA/TraY
MPRLLLLLVHLAFLLAVPAGAQEPPAGFNISWAALDPGDDWTAKVIKSIFPINGAPPTDTGAAANVVGQIIGQLTGFVAAIAMAFVSYTTILNIHRIAETSQILTNAMSSIALVRLGFAAIMMFPLPNGFSTGQAAVVQAAMWGIGMARTVYTSAVKAVGPDAMVIAQPLIPGTGTIVLNLMNSELCRALVNKATNTPGMVPIPTPIQVADINGGGGAITWSYSLSPGHETNSPVCGTVTIQHPNQAGANIAGVTVDMTETQRTILENVVQQEIRPAAEAVAANFWQTKKAEALNPLLGTFQQATARYTADLTTAATDKTAELRAALQDSELARNGGLGLIENQVQLSSLGWTSAGAYYLEFARLNGQTLSLLSATPVINTPSFEGLPKSLKSDLAPLFTAQAAFLTKLKTYVATTDGLSAPGGNADLYFGATPGGDGASTMEQLFRSLNLTETVLRMFTEQMSPTGTEWNDPFGGLIALGNKLVTLAMTAYGLAGIAANTTTTAANTAWNLLTLNFIGAAAAVGTNILMQFFATPIFIGITAILIPGLTIAFVLPMMPWITWITWIAGIAGYLILVCEAVVAVPLWMLAHMTGEGAGLHGRATAGYSLLFNVLFRPVLMLLGLFLGYFIFASMSWLIRMSFGIAAGFVLQNGWLVTNMLGMFVLLWIYVMVHVYAALTSFRMISLVPHHLPHLIGFAPAGRVDMERFANDAAWIGAGTALSTTERGISARRFRPAGGGNRLSHSEQKLLPKASDTSGHSSDHGHTHGDGMDSTLRATTDTNHQPPRDQEN